MKNRKRNVSVCIRMTEEEKAKFDELVAQSGLSQSEYFIKSALNKKIYNFGIKDELKSVQYELSKTGANINQIAKNLNSNIYVGAEQDTKEIRSSLAELQDTFLKILCRVRSLRK